MRQRIAFLSLFTIAFLSAVAGPPGWPPTCAASGLPVPNQLVYSCENVDLCKGVRGQGYEHTQTCTVQCLTGGSCPYVSWATPCVDNGRDGYCCLLNYSPCAPNLCGQGSTCAGYGL